MVSGHPYDYKLKTWRFLVTNVTIFLLAKLLISLFWKSENTYYFHQKAKLILIRHFEGQNFPDL